MNEKALVNIVYCPQRTMLDEFLNYLSLNIDNATTENKPTILMWDYILNFFCKGEKLKKLDTILRTYGLNPINAEDPTRVTSQKTLIDFLITVKYLKTL